MAWRSERYASVSLLVARSAAIADDRLVQITIAGYLLGTIASGVIAQWLGFAALGLVSLAAADAPAALRRAPRAHSPAIVAER